MVKTLTINQNPSHPDMSFRKEETEKVIFSELKTKTKSELVYLTSKNDDGKTESQ
jgi:predicted sulfurtransferase